MIFLEILPGFRKIIMRGAEEGEDGYRKNPDDNAHVYFSFVYLCGLVVRCVILLQLQDQSLAMNQTGEGIWGNLLHFQWVIFQVD